jgi:N-acetyl-anhydromuramyl-L-alanine amidase AmpD
MKDAQEYNRRAMESGALTDAHVVQLVRHFQRAHGRLEVDGKAGPLTRAALDRAAAEPVVPVALQVVHGWLHGEGVQCVPADPSWFGEDMPYGPRAIVAHYTATAPGTALTMAKRRIVPRLNDDRAVSWHVTIGADGTIIQMVSFESQAWHCATGIVPFHGGMRPNKCAVGIELEGHGTEFPDPQVQAACRVWRALVDAYDIPRELAMLEHARLDPGRRSDPGPIWMGEHATRVLDHAFQ